MLDPGGGGIPKAGGGGGILPPGGRGAPKLGGGGILSFGTFKLGGAGTF